jgi:hypothetical protein
MSASATTDRTPFSRRFAARKRPRWVRNTWFATRYLMGSHELTYPLMRFTPAPYSRVRVEPGMDACIDSLPRSANTVGGIAFLERNPGVRLAHHMHVPTQVDRAVRFGVPCAVLIRKPVPNLTSLVIAGEMDLAHDLAYRIYIHYYRRVAVVLDRVAICSFEEVLEDPSVIARRLNEKHGTSFDTTPMTDADKSALVEDIERRQAEAGTRPGHGTVPSAYKERLKPAIRAELSRHPLLPRAEAAYARLARRLPQG